MKRIVFAVALFMTSNGLCQTSAVPKEQDTLLSLLAEVHQLRLSIEAMTVASQRAQIALHALQTVSYTHLLAASANWRESRQATYRRISSSL